MDPITWRAWTWHCQGLDGTLGGATAPEVLSSTGWARTVGGANPYATLFARAGSDRAGIDVQVAELTIHELPSARGCTYLLPAEDFALGLQLSRGAADVAARVVEKLGVRRAEIDQLGDRVVEALADGPLDPAGLKAVLGDSVRNLGEAGKKKGASTTLPAALGILQSAGRIRRIPVGGRLDQQRYSYVRWDVADSGLSDEQARVELLRRYFQWTGGATLAQTRWFTAFGVAHTKAAMAELDLADLGDGVLALVDQADAAREFVRPTKPQYRLVAGIDGLILLRRNVLDLLDEADAARAVPGDRATLGFQSELPDHPIVDRGQIVGLWQFDPDAGDIAWWAFNGADDELRAEIDRTAGWIAAELGDFRSFSLDSPASRRPRIEALRAAQASTR